MIKVNYDAATGQILGFYSNEIEYQSIPEPYVEIDCEQHLDCINNQGLRRVDLTTLKIVEYTPMFSADELMALKLAAIDAEYQPKFAACEELLRRMLLTGEDLTDLKARYSALSNEKDAKILEVMEAV